MLIMEEYARQAAGLLICENWVVGGSNNVDNNGACSVIDVVAVDRAEL